MKLATGIALLFFVAACGGGSGPVAHTTPSPVAAVASPSPNTSPESTPAQSPAQVGPAAVYGIVVNNFLIDGGPTYTINLVRLDGKVQASVTAKKRSRLVQEPNISASRARLYYLDGDASLRYLLPDGTTGAVKTLPVNSSSAAIFAVSPDDSRIAVAIITYPYPVKTRIYVEDLYGTADHIELFSSSTVVEWPVGWNQGHLVIGVGVNASPQNAWDGFSYTANEYHVADAATGTRLATICANSYAFGPPTLSGTVCRSNASYIVSNWAARTWIVPGGNQCRAGVLSRDGQLVADSCADGLVRFVTSGNVITTTPYTATPLGWVDSLDVVVQAQSGALSILNFERMDITAIDASGFFAGTLPENL